MLAHDRLLDLVENFILFDESKPGATRKVVARNHQVLGVNRAVASVRRQEELKRQFPPGERLRHRVVELPLTRSAPATERRSCVQAQWRRLDGRCRRSCRTVRRHRRARAPRPGPARRVLAHAGQRQVVFDGVLRREGAAQGAGQLHLPADDRPQRSGQPDLQDLRRLRRRRRADAARQHRARTLKQLLKENHRYVFSLIHKFNQDVNPSEPYSERDDIIVISDEAHRTQAGRLARNMRLALPNAAFIGFTGTPLFKQDELTKRIFGDYVSRYDFKRSEEDGATVKLVYENRGEKLGVARLDLNDRIAERSRRPTSTRTRQALLEKLLGKDYEVITADDRLDKIAADFVEHCATRWESGKSMLVCIDKITCARMYQRIMPRWQAKAAAVRAMPMRKRAELAAARG